MCFENVYISISVCVQTCECAAVHEKLDPGSDSGDELWNIANPPVFNLLGWALKYV